MIGELSTTDTQGCIGQHLQPTAVDGFVTTLTQIAVTRRDPLQSMSHLAQFRADFPLQGIDNLVVLALNRLFRKVRIQGAVATVLVVFVAAEPRLQISFKGLKLFGTVHRLILRSVK